MEKNTVAFAVSLADEVLKGQMKKNNHKVYEGSGGGQEYIKAVAALASGILETGADKERVASIVLIADDVLMGQMNANGYKVYEGSGGGQVYIMAVAILAAGILAADAK